MTLWSKKGERASIEFAIVATSIFTSKSLGKYDSTSVSSNASKVERPAVGVSFSKNQVLGLLAHKRSVNSAV